MARQTYSTIVSERVFMDDGFDPSQMISPILFRRIIETVLGSGLAQVIFSLGPSDGNHDREFRVTIDDLSNLPDRFRETRGEDQVYHAYDSPDRLPGILSIQDTGGISHQPPVGPVIDIDYSNYPLWNVWGRPTINVDDLNNPLKKPDPIVPRPKDIIRRRG